MKYAILSLTLFMLNCSESQPIKIGLEGQAMPSFSLLLMDSATNLNTGTIPKGQPTVIFFFTPNCPYCRAQIQEIAEDIKSLENIHFYVISSFPFGQIKKYYDEYELKKYKHITVGQDYNSFFISHYKAQEVPYMAVYNKTKQLKQVIIGKTSTNVIKEILIN